jgi:hypothetical protein
MFLLEPPVAMSPTPERRAVVKGAAKLGEANP